MRVAGQGEVGALVLAAGRGERLGHARPKAFVLLRGKSLLQHSIEALLRSGVIDVIQPVLPAGECAAFEVASAPGAQTLVASAIAGGAERQDSMRQGLRAMPESVVWVAVHDAARCLVSPEDVRAVVGAAKVDGAAILAERSRDTMKRVVDGRIIETPDRAECWSAGTPQVIRKDWLHEAVEAASVEGRLATDDAQLVEWRGRSVKVVESTSPNPKMTYPHDLLLGEAILAERDELKATLREGE